MLYSIVIFKNMIGPDDTRQVDLKMSFLCSLPYLSGIILKGYNKDALDALD